MGGLWGEDDEMMMMIIIMKIEVPQQIGNFFNKDASIERHSMICSDRST